MTTAAIVGLIVLSLALCIWVAHLMRPRQPEGPDKDARQAEEPNHAEPSESSAPQTEFRLRDPSGRELLAQLIDRDSSVLFSRADSISGEAAILLGWDKALDTLPPLAAALKGGRWVRILNPEVLSLGQQMRSAGGYLGGIRGPQQFVAQLRFSSAVDVRVIAAPLAVFKMASAVTGQYYLDRIDRQLRSIESEVKAIRQDLRNQTYADISAADAACVELEEAFSLTLDLLPDERIRLINAEGEIDSAYLQKLKDVRDFIDEVDALLAAEKIDPKRADELLRDAANVRVYDMQLLAFAAAVRHKLNLLREVVDDGAEGGRGQLARRKRDRELDEMREDLLTALRGVQKLTLTRAEAKQRWSLPRLKRPPKELDAFYPKGMKMGSFLKEAPERLLPVPEPTPLIVEAFMDQTGTLRVLTEAISTSEAAPPMTPLSDGPPALPLPEGPDHKRARIKALRRREDEARKHDDFAAADLWARHVSDAEGDLATLGRE